MATLKDIGHELGISVTTVSRALNGFPEVSARTRKAVVAAAERLNYQPNPIAQKLVSGRSGMVGMIARLDPDFAADRTFVEIMIGLSAGLAERDVDMVFHVASDADPAEPYRRLAAKNMLDGFILNAPQIDDRRIAYLAQAGIPFVVHGRSRIDADYPFFDIDNAAVSADSVDLLADLGHRRIAFLNGHPGQAYASQRLDGFRSRMAARGLGMSDAAIRHDHPSEAYGYRAALAMLAGAEAPTAFICSSALTAQGVLRAAGDRGLAVPADLSLIAHDDAVPNLDTAAFDPPLTVTHAPLKNACRPLADLLLDAIAGKPAQALQVVERASLIIRASTGAVPPGGDKAWR